jgi:hypothetical protein
LQKYALQIQMKLIKPYRAWIYDLGMKKYALDQGILEELLPFFLRETTVVE